MKTKETIRMFFDNLEEYKNSKQKYEEMGYTIIGYGSDYEWFFTCEKRYYKEAGNE